MKRISTGDLTQFEREGFFILRGLFDPEEMRFLRRAYEEDEAIQKRSRLLADGHGGRTEIALWNHPGEDVFGAVARCARMVDTAEDLLGDEVYHYHSKINTKRPGGGGVWVWHQDYGYWYSNGCLYPDMATAAIPLTRMSRSNGCLQVIPTSNRMGRIDHMNIGEQTGADPKRVDQIVARRAPVPFEAEPGDVMFFHCNTLHTSEANRSREPRNLLLVAYNTRHNDPYRVHGHPGYTPIDRLPDSAVKERGERHDGETRVFMAASEAQG